MDMFTCANCSRYIGNCGNHMTDHLGHIKYELPSEGHYVHEYDTIPTCFEPSEFYLQKKKAETIKEIMKNYTLEELEMALVQLEYEEKNNEQ